MTETGEVICPRKVGPYQIRGTIGQGAYATVKVAFRPDQNKYFACKVISINRIKTEHERESFEREIRIVQQMRDRYVVALYDLLRDSINYYVFFEFCTGGDLFGQIVKCKKMDEATAKIYVKQILLGLKYIHSHHIAHRDMKPENVLIDEHGDAKISDFGLSKYCEDGSLTGTSCGSPCYAAPEVLSGNQYDARKADLWSLGVIIFAMVTGNLPWTKRNKVQLFWQIRSGEYEIPEFLSTSCQSLIKGLMTVNPQFRMSINEALSHSWLVGVDTAASKNVANPPYVSLRTVDRFFEWEEDNHDEENLSNAFIRTASYGRLWTFQKTANIIKHSVSQPTSHPASSFKMKVSPSNVGMGWAKEIMEKEQIEVTEPSIRQLMHNCAVTRKTAKLVRPIRSKKNSRLQIFT